MTTEESPAITRIMRAIRAAELFGDAGRAAALRLTLRLLRAEEARAALAGDGQTFVVLDERTD